MEVEQGTFTPLVFTVTGGMAEECKRYHNRLAELLAIKKGEDYASTVSWLRAKLKYPLLSSARLSSALEVPEEEEEMFPFRTQTLALIM